MTNSTVDKDMMEFKHQLQGSNTIAEELDAIGGASILENAHLVDRDGMNQLLGQIQMSQALANFSNVVGFSKLAKIKKDKSYRALKGVKALDRQGNPIPNVGVWDGFCKALGTSSQKVDEDLKNLDLFGADTLDQLNSLGIGYREMRKLRKLSDEDRSVIIQGESIQIGDKEQVIDLIESMSTRHSKEKQELSDKLQRSQSEQEANKRLLVDKDQKINELDRELRRDLTADEVKQKRQELDVLQHNKLNDKKITSIVALNELDQAISDIYQREDRSEYIEEAIYSTLWGVFKHALLLAREHQIDPVQLLGVAIDQDALDNLLDGEVSNAT